MSNMTPVFVYGTLMRGEHNHRLLERAEYLGAARTGPGFTLVDLGAYPAMIAGDRAVVGEVYGVDQATLARLDRLEGHPNFYHRVAIRLDDGRHVLTYMMDASKVVDRPRIGSGSWRRREEMQCGSVS